MPPSNFNPRSPDGERRTPCRANAFLLRFQSTLPGWGATRVMADDFFVQVHFNPRSPDGERRYFIALSQAGQVFQSTLPGWGATSPRWRWSLRPSNFNPRSPDGERPYARDSCHALTHFNPRSPDGERRQECLGDFQSVVISIHAPRMGSDSGSMSRTTQTIVFQSTLPGWGATHCTPRQNTSGS